MVVSLVSLVLALFQIHDFNISFSLSSSKSLSLFFYMYVYIIYSNVVCVKPVHAVIFNAAIVSGETEGRKVRCDELSNACSTHLLAAAVSPTHPHPQTHVRVCVCERMHACVGVCRHTSP